MDLATGRNCEIVVLSHTPPQSHPELLIQPRALDSAPYSCFSPRTLNSAPVLLVQPPRPLDSHQYSWFSPALLIQPRGHI